MNVRPPPQWHVEAKAMRAAGASVKAIMYHFRKDGKAVRWVLDENGERQANRDRVNQVRARKSICACHEVKKRVPQVAKSRVIDQATKDKAVHDFAAGRIDRATLVARITPNRVSA